MFSFPIRRMQKHTTVTSLYKRWDSGDKDFIGKEHTFIGRIQWYRKLKKGQLLFIDFVDGTTILDLKCVCDKSVLAIRKDRVNSQRDTCQFDELFEKACTGVGLKLVGKIVIPSVKTTQPFELSVTGYRIFGPVQDPSSYVVAGKSQVSSDLLRTKFAHLRERTQTGTAITVIEKMMYHSYDTALYHMGIGKISHVSLTRNDCEGGAEQFLVTRLLTPGMRPSDLAVDKDGLIDFKQDYFGFPVYHTCSGQLEGEYVATATDGIHICTDAGRADPSTGPRHLAKFDMDEPEVVCESLEEVIEIAQTCIRAVIDFTLRCATPELKFLSTAHGKEFESTDLVERLIRYSKGGWPIISHEEAVRRMLEDEDVTFDELPGYHDDFTKQHERYITEKIFGGLPVFVKWYPKKIKSFYMPIVTDDPGKHGVEHVDCFDLLFPIVGEVVGGSMREGDYDKLRKEMKIRGMSEEPLKQYLDIRKDGSLPHGGFGIGMARLMMVLTGILKVQDMVHMPRSKGCFA